MGMRALRFRLVTAVLTALLLVLLAAPASADPGVVHYVGGHVGTAAEALEPIDGGFGP
jgi:hypothetical protein